MIPPLLIIRSKQENMTHRIKNIIASVILLSACVSANAQAFFYNGLRFKIESDETCSLEDSWSAPKYTGDIVVPEKWYIMTKCIL